MQECVFKLTLTCLRNLRWLGRYISRNSMEGLSKSLIALIVVGFTSEVNVWSKPSGYKKGILTSTETLEYLGHVS